MTRNVLNLTDVDLVAIRDLVPGAPAGYGGWMGEIAPRLGAQKLGYNLSVLAPGECAFPLHNHHVNEEMFFILAGVGELRIADTRQPIRAGDVIACPPGGRESAHQIRNSGTVELRFLAVSTRVSPEIVEYPDSGKFGVSEHVQDEGRAVKRFRFLGRPEQALAYWADEPALPASSA